jgi:hypothetical protein
MRPARATHKRIQALPRFYDAGDVHMRAPPPDLSVLALLALCVALFFAPLFPALCGAALAAALPVLAAAHAANTRASTHAEKTHARNAPYDERR